MRTCSHTLDDKVKNTTVTKIDTVYRIITKINTVYKPGVTKYIPADTVYKSIPIDTTAVIKDYFAKIYYEDTIKLDSYGYILIKDTISQNRILTRSSITNIIVPTIDKTITNTIYPPLKNQVYFGFDLMGNKTNPINYFGLALSLKTKKEGLYNIGAGLTSNEGTTLKFGIQWKIKLKQTN